MYLTPNSRSERRVAMCAKVCACALLSVAATGLAYLAFIGFVDSSRVNLVAVIFSVLICLAFSGVMFLFLYGAAKTSVEDYAIQIRILRRQGFRRVKQMPAEEFDRLAAMERAVDQEILERTKERKTPR